MNDPTARQGGPSCVVWACLLAASAVTSRAHAEPRTIGAAKGVLERGAAAGPALVGGEDDAGPEDPMQRIGSLSVGHPHAGFLVNGVPMPPGNLWLLSVPSHAWGTDETIAALLHCIRRLNERFPDSPKTIIGSISGQNGGELPPHKSHRTGRDVDVHFYLKQRKPNTWYEVATADNLDRARTWAFLRLVITETDVEFVLIDRSVQVLLEEYALGIGEPEAWVRSLFHDAPDSRALVRHIPGHTGHMHIRFVSPWSRRRGVEAYDQLVAQGHIQLPQREALHLVGRGDTLGGLALRYGTTVAALRELNDLKSTVIRVGQNLKIRERVDLRGAREPVVVPPRRLPPP